MKKRCNKWYKFGKSRFFDPLFVTPNPAQFQVDLLLACDSKISSHKLTTKM